MLEKYPQNVLDLGTVAGELSKEAAEELGLKAGTPVAEGGVDAYVGALGLGVVEPGKMALITGSSHVMIGQTEKPIHDPGFWGAYTDAMIPGQYTVEAGQAPPAPSWPGSRTSSPATRPPRPGSVASTPTTS